MKYEPQEPMSVRASLALVAFAVFLGLATQMFSIEFRQVPENRAARISGNSEVSNQYEQP